VDWAEISFVSAFYLLRAANLTTNQIERLFRKAGKLGTSKAANNLELLD
jgi:hypothetical protein